MHGRDPRWRLVPRADRGRGPHGDRRGLRRASRTSASSPTAPSSGTACRRPPTSTTTARGRSRSRPTVTAAGPDAEPEWEQIADGGTYAWHDHRVHWMDDSSPSVDRGEPVAGAYDPWRCRSSSTARQPRCRAPSSTRSRCRRSPTSALAVIVAGLARLLRPRGRACALAAALLAVVSLARDRGRLGRLRLHPRRRRQPAALGAGGRRARHRRRAPSSLASRRAGVVLALASVAVAVGLGAVPHRGPLQAGAADRAPLRPRPHRRRPRPRRERRRRRRRGRCPAALASPPEPTGACADDERRGRARERARITTSRSS